MENMNMDEFEAKLNEIQDPNPKTEWWNEAVFRTTLNTILYLEIALFGFCILIGPLGFDLDSFILGQKIMIIPVLVVGFKVAMNEKAYKTKKTLDSQIKVLNKDIDGLKAKVSDKNNEIYALKIQLGDKCETLAANAEALEKVS